MCRSRNTWPLRCSTRPTDTGLKTAFISCAPCSAHRIFSTVGKREGQLDDYDLATRLSFFLTSSPPDTLLQKLANKGQLSDQTVLEEQTRRLLKDKGVKNFLTSFTGQWLNLRILPDIMPDSRLLKWTDKHTNAITAETELFVAEIMGRISRSKPSSMDSPTSTNATPRSMILSFQNPIP